MIVPVANAGLKVPALMVKFARLATGDSGRNTIITAFFVDPSSAVIMVVMVVGPTVSGMLCDNEPDATAWPFTVIVARLSCAVAITCVLAVLLVTVA